ncbi:BREX-1 system adenine-specific DNA-methyltransferase PglX [Bengtsoniella intestinalis]|uniref:BREX-1 system adenine-specific DNA-methyltransferase PglX n=1 Tax=Bengtsoniella intestinalis TaxID=3073143 RepID=UPI00391EF1BD
MNKTAIKNYAIEARRKLMDGVRTKLTTLSIYEDGHATTQEAVEKLRAQGVFLSEGEVRARERLCEKLTGLSKELGDKKAFVQVIEAVAYTWFNRFVALRYMEVNDYLPSGYRILSSVEVGRAEPDAVRNAQYLDFVSQTKVEQFRDDTSPGAAERFYRYLLVAQCNALHDILPAMFQRIEDDTELLLPDNLYQKGGVVHDLVSAIHEDDFKDQVQIIGWLYQYYNTEPKADVFGRPKTAKIQKEDIPAATQLFTPDWIVRYMVENSLGRIAVEKLGLDPVVMGWKYYLPEAEQTPDVMAQLKVLANDDVFQLEELKIIDPCMGSGHILVYAFDVLMQIYESQGYTNRDAVRSILQKNLYGLDIDPRAHQLAYFAVMMRGRKYDNRFFRRNLMPHLYIGAESNGIRRSHLAFMGQSMNPMERNMALVQVESLLDAFQDGKEYGSLVSVEDYRWDLIGAFIDDFHQEGQFSMEAVGLEDTVAGLQALYFLGQALAQKYDVVVTNPPYMSMSNGSPKLIDFAKKHYPDSKSDLFAVFMEKCLQMAKPNGYSAMITMHSWMFLSSYEKLRGKMMNYDIINMAHLGARAFEEIGGEVVQTTSWVMQKHHTEGYQGSYVRLVDFNSQDGKEAGFLSGACVYSTQQENFGKIPGSPIAYWVKVKDGIFSDTLSSRFASGGRNKTHNDERYVRYHWEVRNSNPFWKVYLNGGSYRKYYGNNIEVVLWTEESKSEYQSHGGKLKDSAIQQEGVFWNKITSNLPGFCFKQKNWIFSSNAPTIISEDSNANLMTLAFLNSKVLSYYLKAMNPTVTTNPGNILSMPLLPVTTTVDTLVQQNIAISRADWDDFETSWDFKRNPLI